jgi:uncharacterized protein (DUF427 family)
MAKARWNGVTLAESDHCIVVEGNYYFPPEAVEQKYLKSSATRTRCLWKGVASYYDIEVHGACNRDAAWYYPDPTRLAQKIKGYIAFWHGVEIER